MTTQQIQDSYKAKYSNRYYKGDEMPLALNNMILYDKYWQFAKHEFWYNLSYVVFLLSARVYIAGIAKHILANKT